jgi:hypothetical protein
MRDCMLVNPSGLLGHWIAIDMNIEHLIQYLKVCYISTKPCLTNSYAAPLVSVCCERPLLFLGSAGRHICSD